MRGPSGRGRDILLLAAEDAFEFERWRDAGPLTADIDAEVSAAEIAEFEALGIPMPRDLDSLKREMEHAPKVGEAIRNASLALRRSGRASSAALVALAPHALVHPSLMDPRLMGAGPMAMDPRLMGIDPRLAGSPRSYDPRMAAGPPAEPTRRRGAAGVTVIGDSGPIEAELMDAPGRSTRRARRRADAFDDQPVDALGDEDPFDDGLDDEDEREARARERRRDKQARARKARARRERDWDDDEFDDDDDDSLIAAVPVRPPGQDRNTLIVGGIAAVAIIALLWVSFGKDDDPEDQQADAQQQQAPQPAPQPQQPAPAPAPAIDPNTGLPYGQAPGPVADAGAPSPAPSGRRSGGGGGGGSRGSSSSAPIGAGGGGGGGSNDAAPGAAGALGGLANLSDGPGAQPAPSPAQPSPGGAAPANGQPAPANGQPAPANGQPAPANGQPAPANGGQTQPDAGGQPGPGGQAKPAPEEPKLATKQKMTAAQRSAITNKVGEIYACHQDATIAKPDLAGTIVFTLSLDQDGVVKKVDVAKDPMGYGVAKCAKKKMLRWTLPSGGIPMIFDLPLKFG